MTRTISREPRGAATRNRAGEVFAHAVKALNSRGVSQTSLGQIAADTGISRAALYYYVDDLQDLVFKCYRETCEKLSAQLAAVVREGGDEAEVVARFVARALTAEGSDFASLSEIGYLDDQQRQTILGLYDGLLAQLAGVIAKGVSAGRLRPCDAWIAAHVILSLIFWTPLADGWSPPAIARRSHSTRASAVADLALNGIGAPPVAIDRLASVDFSPLFPSSRGLFDKEYLTLARREALLRAASQLFSAKGVDATSLEEIAASVGTTKRAIIHYFRDKQSLVEHAYRRAYSIYLHIPQVVGQADLRPIEQIASAYSALPQALLRDDIAPLMPRAGVEGLSNEARRELQAAALALNAEYLGIFARARVAGELRDFDEGAFHMIASGAFAWLTRGIFSAREDDQPRIGREISELLLCGLRRID